MIGLVKRFAIYGIAVTAEPKLFEEIMPNLPEIGSAYSFCAHACLVAVRSWADEQHYQGDIAYFFESGHASQSEANRIMNELFSTPEWRLSYRYVSHTFADKKKVRPLQSADLLAWQWQKDHKRRMEGRKKEPRKDCYTLIHGPNPPHYVIHYTEAQLRWFAERALHRTFPLNLSE